MEEGAVGVREIVPFETYQRECHQQLEVLFASNEFMATALRLTKNARDAEDLLQDTFFRATKAIGRRGFKLGTNMKAWLHTIMRNTFINNFRKRKGHRTDSWEDIEQALRVGDPREKFRDQENAVVNNVLVDVRASITTAYAEKGPWKSVDFNAVRHGILDRLDAAGILSEEIQMVLRDIYAKFALLVLLTDLLGFEYKETAKIMGIPMGTVMSGIYRGRNLMRADFDAASVAYEDYGHIHVDRSGVADPRFAVMTCEDE